MNLMLKHLAILSSLFVGMILTSPLQDQPLAASANV
jgi:hypothetical protein